MILILTLQMSYLSMKTIKTVNNERVDAITARELQKVNGFRVTTT